MKQSCFFIKNFVLYLNIIRNHLKILRGLHFFGFNRPKKNGVKKFKKTLVIFKKLNTLIGCAPTELLIS
jgi:hypothetical protein